MDAQKNQPQTPQEQMETQKNQAENTPKPAVSSSCRKKEKDDNVTFLANFKDHMGEFLHASMDEHKTCFKDTMNKIFGRSKAAAENKAEANEVKTHSTLQATVAE